MTYNEWIARWLASTSTPYGRCRQAVNEMALSFPELTKVAGHVEDGAWGRRAHWWLITPDGRIVDPTATQFPVLMEYAPWQPGDLVRAGKCMNCGQEIWRPCDDLKNPPFTSVCSDACDQALMSEYGGFST